jgi:tetratricopeptide (TPR) repeat protein
MNKAGMHILIIAVFVMLFAPAMLAGPAELNSPGALFYQGNTLYQDGKYEQAINAYQKILDMGWESGNLYYNIGNSYLKEGKPGMAVLSYEKAMAFIPNDSDLRSNYGYVLQGLKHEPQVFGGWFERMACSLFRGMTIDLLTVFLCCLYIISIAYLILILFFKRLKVARVFFAGIVLPVFIVSLYGLAGKIDYQGRICVVTGRDADVRFEPLENATVYFELSEGDKVKITDKNGDWYKIKRFDNKTGWLKKDALSK